MRTTWKAAVLVACGLLTALGATTTASARPDREDRGADILPSRPPRPATADPGRRTPASTGSSNYRGEVPTSVGG
jgi:hypothetical protein